MPGGLWDVSENVDFALLTGWRECVCVLFLEHICNECYGADAPYCARTRVYVCVCCVIPELWKCVVKCMSEAPRGNEPLSRC